MESVEEQVPATRIWPFATCSLLATFTLCLIGWNANQNVLQDTKFWWDHPGAPIALVLLVAFSYLIVRRLGASDRWAIVLTPILALAQIGATMLLILGLFYSAMS